MSDEPSTGQNRAEQPTDGVRPAVSEANPQPHCKPHQTEGRKHPFAESFAIVIAVLAFGAAAWQGYVASDYEKQSLRAYVFVEGQPGVHMINSVVGRVQVIYKIENVGQTPAYGVVKSDTIFIATYPLPSNFDFSKLKMVGPFGGASVYPHGRYQGHVESSFAPLDWNDVKDGRTRRLYLVGTLTYDDVFGSPHYIDFCLAYGGSDVETSGAAGYCEQHNDAR